MARDILTQPGIPLRVVLGLIFLITTSALIGVGITSAIIVRGAISDQYTLILIIQSEEKVIAAIENAFGNQIDSWKNLLLRGHIAQLYYRYLQQFYQTERETVAESLKLRALVDRNPAAKEATEEFLIVHKKLGRSFREALRIFSASEADAQIRADELVANLEDLGRRSLENLNQVLQVEIKNSLNEQKEYVDRIEWLTLLVTAILAICILVFVVLFTDRRIGRPIAAAIMISERVARGELESEIEIGASNEVGRLMDALHMMQDALIEARNAMEEDRIAELELKNAELERFAYTVSHDLKSPLVTVKGFLGLLEKDIAGGDADRVEKDIQHIKSATDQMASLLDDLLELSRIGQIVNKPEQFSLNQLTEEVIFLLQGQIKESGAEIDIATDMPSVLADKRRIGEVMQNLLENAIKFAGEGKTPKISVSAELQDNRVLCRIQDNGIGIEPRFQDKIFGLFDRLDSNVEGTGVGLALVKRIVEVHDCEIWLESDGDGQGTVFCFTLPVPQGSIR